MAEKRIPVTVVLPKRMYELVEKERREMGLNKSAFLNYVLYRYFKEVEKHGGEG